MKKKSVKVCVLSCAAILAAYLICINRPIKQQDLFGFYCGVNPYTQNDQSVFMLFLDKEGTYLYSYMHKDGTRSESSDKWEFYVNDSGTSRVVLYNAKIVGIDNVVPNMCFEDFFVKRNLWGKIIIPVDYDCGMLLVKQQGYKRK